VVTGRLRDPATLAAALAKWLRHRRPGAARPNIEALSHASAGLSNETLLVTVAWGDGPSAARERLVVRLPPLQASFPEYDLEMQALVHRAVAQAGVPAPTPVTYEPEAAWLGAPFLVMPFVDGHIPGQAPPFDPWVMESPASEQRALHDAFIDILAAIHRIDWVAAGLGVAVRGAGQGLGDEVKWWLGYLLWASDGQPAVGLARALEWCSQNCPTQQPESSLLWGDPRLGNLILSRNRQVLAVLDWEGVSIGPAEMDLGWYVGLDSMLFELTGASVPGFPDRAQTVARFEERLGRAVVDLEWHEIFALTRAAAINDRQARLAEASGRRHPGGSGDTSPMVGVLGGRIAAAGG
jgi:aminoglycoside phosphotransferase (APT) family kinase protein